MGCLQVKTSHGFKNFAEHHPDQGRKYREPCLVSFSWICASGSVLKLITNQTKRAKFLYSKFTSKHKRKTLRPVQTNFTYKLAGVDVVYHLLS